MFCMARLTVCEMTNGALTINMFVIVRSSANKSRENKGQASRIPQAAAMEEPGATTKVPAWS